MLTCGVIGTVQAQRIPFQSSPGIYPFQLWNNTTSTTAFPPQGKCLMFQWHSRAGRKETPLTNILTLWAQLKGSFGREMLEYYNNRDSSKKSCILQTVPLVGRIHSGPTGRNVPLQALSYTKGRSMLQYPRKVLLLNSLPALRVQQIHAYSNTR